MSLKPNGVIKMSNEEKGLHKSSINWEITTYGKLYKGEIK